MLHLQRYKQTEKHQILSEFIWSVLIQHNIPVNCSETSENNWISAVRNSKHVGRVCFSPIVTTQAARMKILELQLHAHTLQLAVRLLMLRGMSFT